VTHVLLPTVALLRRRDLVEVIGRALLAKAAGRGHRQVAAELGVPATTVRGWLRRLAERAELVRGHFTRLAVWLDPQGSPVEPRGSPLADAVEAIGTAAVAAARRFGSGVGPWEFASGATSGQLLANTNAPFPAPW
jgi:Homeodomain-like domain